MNSCYFYHSRVVLIFFSYSFIIYFVIIRLLLFIYYLFCLYSWQAVVCAAQGGACGKLAGRGQDRIGGRVGVACMGDVKFD